MFNSGKTRRLTSWLKPRLRVEALEDRAVPATLFVDDSLVAGASIASLGPTVQVTADRDASGTLTTGDQVSIAVGETGTTTKLTYNAATNTAAGDVGSAYATVQAAVTVAAAGDAIAIAKGTYAESLTIPLQLTLDGLTNVATDVKIDSTSGAGVTITGNGVTLRDLEVTGSATDGVVATGVAALTLNNVMVDGSTGMGLNLTGTNAAGSQLTLTDVTVSGNTGAGLSVGGFETVFLSGVSLTAGSGAPQSAIVMPAGLANATLNVSATGSTPTTFTVTGTSVQVGTGEVVSLANADNLNLTGGSGADTFVVTAPSSGTPAITISGGLPVPGSGTGTAGDVLDLTSTSGLTVNATPSNNGFSGTISFGSLATLNFSGIERFADGATVGGRVTNQSSVGVANVTVQIDAGANGTVDLTTTTDASGNFSVAGLPPGDYRVRVVLPAGATQTSTNPGDFTNVALGQTISNVNFQLQTPTTATGGTVTGLVYADTNPQNGTRDGGENGVRNVTVYLDLNGNGKLDGNEPTARTDNTGAYTLTTTQNGTFAVRAVLPAGYLQNSGYPTVSVSGGSTATADIGLFTNLPPQATPSRRLAAGYVIGGQARVKVYGEDGKEQSDLALFSGLRMTDVRVAVADVTGDGVDDVIVGTGPGVQNQVVVLDGKTLQEVARFSPFETTYTGGVFLAAGDLTGDGIADIVVSADVGGGPRVVVQRGGPPLSFPQVASFFGIDDIAFRGGARVAVADFNRDGVPDLVVAAGVGGGPRVAVFNGTTILSTPTRLFGDFFVFELALRNGAYIAAGDIDGDGFADLIAGGGPGGGPRVLALSGRDLMDGKRENSRVLANFFADDANGRSGIQVTARDLDGDGRADLVTGTNKGGKRRLQVFNAGRTGNQNEREFEFGDDSGGGVSVG